MWNFRNVRMWKRAYTMQTPFFWYFISNNRANSSVRLILIMIIIMITIFNTMQIHIATKICAIRCQNMSGPYVLMCVWMYVANSCENKIPCMWRYLRKFPFSFRMNACALSSHLILSHSLETTANLILWQFWFYLILSFCLYDFFAIVNNNAIIYISRWNRLYFRMVCLLFDRCHVAKRHTTTQ